MIIQAELKPKPIKYKIEMLDITYIKKKLKKNKFISKPTKNPSSISKLN
jgi:hypothetical protein